MNIVHFIPSLNAGGAEKFVIDLSNELSKNHNVYIYLLHPLSENSFLAKQLSENVTVRVIRYKGGIDPHVMWQIFRLIKKDKITIVNIHLRLLIYALPSILLSINHIKWFQVIHNVAKEDAGTSLDVFIRKLLFRLKIVFPISISDRIDKTVKDLYGKNIKTITIENGVKRAIVTSQYEIVKNEVNTHKKDTDTKVFLTIGRMTYQKNHEMLLNVFSKLREQNVILLIIGSDPDPLEKMFTLLKSIKTDNVHFLGAKSNVQDYLACSNFFVLSSRFEGLPITLLESLSMGTIPICTPVGGIPDVIKNGTDGILAKGSDEQSMYSAIEKSLSLTSDECLEYSTSCQNVYSQKYDIEITTQCYLSAYKNF